jgi:hypothetical protein
MGEKLPSKPSNPGGADFTQSHSHHEQGRRTNAVKRMMCHQLLALCPSCKIRNFGDNAPREHFAVLGNRTRPASKTTKAMRKKNGLGRPHHIEQHNDRQRLCSRVPAFALLLQAQCLTEVNCAV